MLVPENNSVKMKVNSEDDINDMIYSCLKVKCESKDVMMLYLYCHQIYANGDEVRHSEIVHYRGESPKYRTAFVGIES